MKTVAAGHPVMINKNKQQHQNSFDSNLKSMNTTEENERNKQINRAVLAIQKLNELEESERRPH